MGIDQREAKLAALKHLQDKENQLKDIETCTFKPDINKYSPHSHSFIDGDVVERNLNWKKHKEQKLNQMKKQREEDENRECTFKPNISSFIASDTSNTCLQSMNSEAIEKFLKRQKEARSKKEESKIYEEYIMNGGSACQDSYGFKAHKNNVNKNKTRTKQNKPTMKEQNLTRLFSFAQSEFDQVAPSTQDIPLSYSDENATISENLEESQIYSESQFDTNKQQKLMKEVEYLD